MRYELCYKVLPEPDKTFKPTNNEVIHFGFNHFVINDSHSGSIFLSETEKKGSEGDLCHFPLNPCPTLHGHVFVHIIRSGTVAKLPGCSRNYVVVFLFSCYIYQ